MRVSHVRDGRNIAGTVPGAQDAVRLADGRDLFARANAAAMDEIVPYVVNEMLIHLLEAIPLAGPQAPKTPAAKRATSSIANEVAKLAARVKTPIPSKATTISGRRPRRSGVAGTGGCR